MVSLKFRIFALCGVIIFFAAILGLIKEKKIKLKYAMIWLISDFFLLILDLFPGLLKVISQLFGVYSSVNVLFSVFIFCSILIMASLTVIVSKQSYRIKELAQTVALLEKQVVSEKKTECDKPSAQGAEAQS